MERVYLDNNATTTLLPEVRDAVARAMAAGASNASSAHSGGDAARSILASCRDDVGRLIGSPSESLVFTSGGAEANNLVLQSVALATRGKPARILTTEVEHASVLRACEALEAQGAEIAYLPVDADGRVVVSEASEMIVGGADLVSVQWVNNETGVIQPVEEIGKLCRSRGVAFHTDAAQAVGKLPAAIADMPIDYLSLTAHKWHGPAGVGAAYVAPGRRLSPMIHGGGQEHGLRAGTENLLGIAGMGCAADLRRSRLDAACRHMGAVRDLFEKILLSRLPGIRINGQAAPRVCNTSNVTFAGADGQAMVARLDQRGVCCSQGSACEASRPEPSHVLRAMGLSEEKAYSSLRFSFSELTTDDEIRIAVDVLVDIYTRLSGNRIGQAPAAGRGREK
jgi:cysteine desulfurase